MPGSTASRLRASITAPLAGRLRVVMLTTFDDEEYIVEGLRAGAHGYLLKDTSSDQLVQAIRAAYRGEAPLQPSVAVKLVARIARVPEPEPINAPATRRKPCSTRQPHPDRMTSPTRTRHPRLLARGDEQPRDRRDVVHHRGHGQEPRLQYPQQADAARPHAGRPLGARAWAGGASLNRRPLSLGSA